MHFGGLGLPPFSFPLSLRVPQGIPPGLLQVLTPAAFPVFRAPTLDPSPERLGGGLWASGPWVQPPRPAVNTPGGGLCVHKTLRAGFQASFQSKLGELGVGKTEVLRQACPCSRQLIKFLQGSRGPFLLNQSSPAWPTVLL